MVTSGKPDRRRRARVASALLSLVAGLVVGNPASAQPDRGSAPLLRLERQPGSVVRSVELPLVASRLARVGGGESRTRRLATTTYKMVGLTWRGRDPRLRVRTHDATGWSRWAAVEPLTDLPDDVAAEARRSGTHGTSPLWVGASDGVQVSVRGARPSDLELVLIDPGVLPGDATVSDPQLARTLTTTGAPRPSIHSRKEWGADESWRDGGPWYNRTIQQVHVHHTVTGNTYAAADVPGLIRGMYRYHTHNLGWSDIGYNFLVDRFGRAWLGRAGGAGKPVRGAHTLGFNNTSVGISMIGNFETAAPTEKALTAVVRLAAWKLDRYHRRPQGWATVYSHGSDRYAEGQKVRLRVIDGHRDTNETACPGEHLYDALPGIRRRAQSRVDRY